MAIATSLHYRHILLSCSLSRICLSLWRSDCRSVLSHYNNSCDRLRQINRYNSLSIGLPIPSTVSTLSSLPTTHSTPYSTLTPIAMTFNIDQRGALNSIDYRVYYKDKDGLPISPWHDIPLFADEGNRIYNMVVEIPRWTNAKMEISTKEALNPIKQDVKKDALRYVRNPFPHKGYIWNYGALPQTWEDPKHLDEATGAKGDNDPIDVLEIGSRVANRGDVLKVKILGVMALIDEGETDWKLITIDIEDPLADQLNDIEDVEMLMPGLIRATHEWLKIYKIPDGKPPNEFAFNGEAKNREFAERIIAETHKYWRDLISGDNNESELNLKNTTLSNSLKIDGPTEGQQIINQKPESSNTPALPIADQTAIDKWYYITLA